MPARDADPTRAPDPGTDLPAAGPGHDDPADERRGTGPEDDPATARIRALLRQPEPWPARLGARLAAFGIERRDPPVTRAVVVVALAVGLGVAVFGLWGGRGAAVDPVQVLPRASGGSAPGASAGSPEGGSTPTGDAAVVGPSGPSGTAPELLSVHAAGAVAQPGVHRVPADARVADLVAVAGGFTVEADPDRINLAAPLHDGERVYVPRRGETAVPEVVAGGGTDPSGPGAGGGGGPSPGAAPVERVDLNTADAAALDSLPGVGPATAAAIIEHRTQHGPFRSVAELQDVAGIGPARFERLRDLVRV